MQGLWGKITEQTKAYADITHAIDNGSFPISLHGLSEEALFQLFARYADECQVVLVFSQDHQARAARTMIQSFVTGIVHYFPARPTYFYDIEAFSHENMNQRLRTLHHLQRGSKGIYVTCTEAMMNPMLPKKQYGELRLVVGQMIEPQKVIESLVKLGYRRETMIEGPGQFSARGGIIDCFPSDAEDPLRLEFFDIEIDSIRSFDLGTQRSFENSQEALIPAAVEFILTQDQRQRVAVGIEKDLAETTKKEKHGAERTKRVEKFEKVIHQIESDLPLPSAALCYPYLEESESLLNWLQADAVLVLEEPDRILEAGRDQQHQFHHRLEELHLAGETLSRHAEALLPFEQLPLENRRLITSTRLLKNSRFFAPKALVQVRTKANPVFHRKFELLAQETKRLLARDGTVVFFTGSTERALALKQYLEEARIPVLSDFQTQPGFVTISKESLNQGFEYIDEKIFLFGEAEVYGGSKRKRRKREKEKSRRIETFMDLKVGDYVVHEEFGIGQYQGIEQKVILGIKRDYLIVQYRGTDRLYVPVDQMQILQKFIGGDAGSPRLNKMGSDDWKRTKQTARKAIEIMARELLEHYAKRESVKGYAFSDDNEWQRQFEDLFPYEETQDQLQCIEEIKSDMQKPSPMDRLLCGDVGYGKTEVALRAAFKAVLDGKQVAILVPTTILAQQHYNTFLSRFQEFPVKVEMLSRFRTAKQQQSIFRDVKAGNIDVIVGTHRILSKNLQYKDLGLLIVDEEQRFGVRHKEAMKMMKASVDVLTLSATPIPRTLHMSMIGVRDLSVIDEPPEERLPVQTFVVEYQEELVRDAIRRELEREGQVYFVFNRVKGIRSMQGKLQKLIPEARIAVAHGQMGERELEAVMVAFLDGEIDVLISTTIIETGMDIPNVNTMIIFDADRLGLSQLYQLRGRIGRSNRLAFAYFTFQKNKVLSEVAEKRLKAIREFTEFGAGFKIAMRDLEIRGAGNLLGAEQHGHMASIGYDLYVKYLEQAVSLYTGSLELGSEESESKLELQVDAYIPDEYIQDAEQKIRMYKRIATIESTADYSEILDELIDRFGEPPAALINLMRIAKVRAGAKHAGFSTISHTKKGVVMNFAKALSFTPELGKMLMDHYARMVDFDLSTEFPKIFLLKRDCTAEEALLLMEEAVGMICEFFKN
ncbi:transcription-repair coupling factor [Gottschalkiaceae bacterium SANA]|nr:transcription-repair coupling factor [Gottschalkiaceae bacterium SANA]